MRRCAKSRIIIQSTIHGREAIMSGSRASLQCRQHTHWESSAAMNIADDLINIWIMSFALKISKDALFGAECKYGV